MLGKISTALEELYLSDQVPKSCSVETLEQPKQAQQEPEPVPTADENTSVPITFAEFYKQPDQPRTQTQKLNHELKSINPIAEERIVSHRTSNFSRLNQVAPMYGSAQVEQENQQLLNSR